MGWKRVLVAKAMTVPPNIAAALHRSRYFRLGELLLVIAVLVVGGCSSATTPAQEAITGLWAESFSVPGNSFEMNLVAAGTRVIGSGHACGEAGPCSDLTISGTSDGSGVHLLIVADITLPNPGGTSTSTFAGKLVSVDELRGNLVPQTQGQVADPVLVVFLRE
jgi:hypothetical protein